GDDPAELALLADGELRRGRPREALRLLERGMADKEDSYWLWFAKARCQERLGDDAGAAASYATCLALVPGAAPALFGPGLAGLRWGDHAGALADLDRVVARWPDMAEARINRALARLGLGREREALADLGAALEWPAPYTRVYFLRAQLRERLGDRAG